jgi:hypothetical protein
VGGARWPQARVSEAWRSRITGHADVSPSALVPNPRNWPTHPSEQQRALAGALGEVGWVTEVIVNQTTGRLVDGHLRVELALERQEPTVPVTYVELTEAEERLVLATLDPIGAMAAAEEHALESLLASLDPADADLRAFIEELARSQEIDSPRTGLVDPDDVPDLPEQPGSSGASCTGSVSTDCSALTRPNRQMLRASSPAPPPTLCGLTRPMALGTRRSSPARRRSPGIGGPTDSRSRMISPRTSQGYCVPRSLWRP